MTQIEARKVLGEQSIRSHMIVRRGSPRPDTMVAQARRNPLERITDMVGKLIPYRSERIIGENFPSHTERVLAADIPSHVTGQTSLSESVVQPPSQKRSREKIQQKPASEFSPHMEKKIDTSFREVRVEDLDGIMELFKEWRSVRKSKYGRLDADSNHVGHEDVTAYIPSDWNNEEQVARFRDVLKTFYFSGTFKTTARYTGEELEVDRITEVCVVDDKEIAGVYSILTKDPYVPVTDKTRIDNGRIKPLYAHMVLVKDNYRRNRITSWFVGRFAKRFMIEGPYNQITAGIDRVGDWQPIYDTSMDIGFNEDWRPSGRYSYLDADGKKVDGFRIILKKEDWEKERERVYQRAILKLGKPQTDEV